MDDDIEKMLTGDINDRELISSLKAKAYDIVLNGNEIGGGSIRIHKRDVQKKMFELLRISDEDARMKFGFLLDALEYGASTARRDSSRTRQISNDYGGSVVNKGRNRLSEDSKGVRPHERNAING